VVSGVLTRLRAARDDERALLDQWRAEPSSPFDDYSGPPPPLLSAEERAAPRVRPGPGWGELVVTDGDDVPLGSVGWHPVVLGPGPGSTALNIGISLRPPARGRGHGERAQRLLADYLFATTSVHRVEASTDVDNVAEQRALTRAGYAREGVSRGAQWRAGAYRDMVVFARLRGDA
jgi:RimJ/RimL family protein N-acetyltransferase